MRSSDTVRETSEARTEVFDLKRTGNDGRAASYAFKFPSLTKNTNFAGQKQGFCS